MQPLNATARPRCGSTIGCAPRSDRSMMLSRRWPSPAPLWDHSPAPSGRRGAIDSDIRASAAASAGRPSWRSSPAMPHTAHQGAIRPDGPGVGAGLDGRAMLRAARAGKSRRMRRFDLVPGYAAPRVHLDPPPLIGVSTSEMRVPARTRSLAGAVGEEIDHRQEVAGRIPTHQVVLESGTRLEGVMGRLEHDVNSFHHQAVERLGEHLRAVAWAPDGVIEGIEATDRDFVLGV